MKTTREKKSDQVNISPRSMLKTAFSFSLNKGILQYYDKYASLEKETFSSISLAMKYIIRENDDLNTTIKNFKEYHMNAEKSTLK